MATNTWWERAVVLLLAVFLFAWLYPVAMGLYGVEWPPNDASPDELAVLDGYWWKIGLWSGLVIIGAIILGGLAVWGAEKHNEEIKERGLRMKNMLAKVDEDRRLREEKRQEMAQETKEIARAVKLHKALKEADLPPRPATTNLLRRKWWE
mgnify:CR=1 FL=1